MIKIKVSKKERLRFLEKLQENHLDLEKTCEALGIGWEEGRDYEAFTEESVKAEIYALERQLYQENYPRRDYKKQEVCQHENFTIFLKCQDCLMAIGENQLDEVEKIIQKEKERRKEIKVIVQLVNA